MIKRILSRVFLIASGVYAVLLIPDRSISTFDAAAARPFTWNMNETWSYLEQAFAEALSMSAPVRDSIAEVSMSEMEELLTELQSDSVISYNDTRLTTFLDHFFAVAPIFAASKETGWYVEYYNRARDFWKLQSVNWNLDEPMQREAMYRLLYGMRAAIEEVLLQRDTIQFNPVQVITLEPSVTPSASLQAITVQSGDLLVSRGGAEVSAFISRGNDYPGNFSHVALLYVDADNNTPNFIEAHIEKGVAIATANEYLKDKKLRFMVLRPRATLPQLVQNPMLPHEAARTAWDEVHSRHIPYDFKMDFYDQSAMFCSEVASYAYRQHGVHLWQAVSTISSQGTANWLNAFGVENFVTQMPSDLEYDPQLSIVAEWCDPETLLKDHIDSAVMDALLERANEGLEIGYNRWLLPLARIVKLFSMLQNTFGSPGIIPEGMSATQALKNNTFVELYAKTRDRTEIKVHEFTTSHGYRPPYWQMLAMARQSILS